MDLNFLQINDFQSFYQTTLGQKIRKSIFNKIVCFWPEIANTHNKNTPTKNNGSCNESNKKLGKKLSNIDNQQILLGIGYTEPYIRDLNNNFHNFTITSRELMLSKELLSNGSDCNSDNSDNEDNYNNLPTDSIISNIYQLPFADSSVDKIVIIHSLEFSNNQSKFLREIWRVTKDEGKVIFIVPNRLSIWSKIHKTPFGHGHPFSPIQLDNLLSNSLFTIINRDVDIFIFPGDSGIFSKILSFFHYIGRTMIKISGGFLFGGVLIVEAKKETYGVTPIRGKKICFEEKFDDAIVVCLSNDL